MVKKIPKYQQVNLPDKETKHINFEHEKCIVWKFKKIQLDGDWGWKNIDSITLLDNLIPKIIAWESMNIEDFIGSKKKDHILSADSIAPEGRKLLKKIGCDDFNVLSLHLDGKKRVIGVKFKNIVYILFWDPEHTFAPSNFKNN